MIGSVSLHARVAGVVSALGVAALLASAPVAAQGTEAPPAGSAATDSCEPGALGEGGTYSGTSEADGDIVGAEIAYQCTRTLDDGTYVPEGYRVTLSRACEEGTCELPLLFATAGRNGAYRGIVDAEGEPMTVRLRTNRNGALVVTAVSGAGRGPDRERNRYVLRQSR